MFTRWPKAAAVFAVISLICLSAPAAWAETRAVVAVGACGDGQTLEATRQVRDALVQTPFGYQFLSEAATAERLGGMPGSLTEAKVLLDSARDDLFRREQPAWARAEKNLKKALGVLETALPSEERWELFAQTSAVLSFTLFQQAQGRQELLRAAETTLFPVLAVDRTVVLDPQHFLLPSWTRGFVGLQQDRTSTDTVRGKLRAMPKGELEVLSTPEGLPVSVNGRPIGTTPLKLTFAQGSYIVEGVFPGRRGLPRRVTLEAGKVVQVVLDPVFDGAVHQTKGPCLVTPADQEERVRLLARLGRTLGVESVIGVRIHEAVPGERYYVAGGVDTESGRERHGAQIPIEATGPRPGALAQLAEFLLEGKVPRAPTVVEVLGSGGAGGTKPRPDKKPEDGAKQSPSSRSSVLRPLGWTGVGLGAAGLIGAGYFFAERQDYSDRMEAVCPGGGCSDEPSLEAYTQLRSKRDDQTRWMAIAGAAGVVLAGAGGAALLFGDEDSGQTVSAAVSPAGVTLWGRF